MFKKWDWISGFIQLNCQPDTSLIHFSLLDSLHAKPVENCLNQRSNRWPAQSGKLCEHVWLGHILKSAQNKHRWGQPKVSLIWLVVGQARVSLIWLLGCVDCKPISQLFQFEDLFDFLIFQYWAALENVTEMPKFFFIAAAGLKHQLHLCLKKGNHWSNLGCC